MLPYHVRGTHILPDFKILSGYCAQGFHSGFIFQVLEDNFLISSEVSPQSSVAVKLPSAMIAYDVGRLRRTTPPIPGSLLKYFGHFSY
jgi:hypothetical protein